jgi:hypothetical protein
MMVLEVGGKNVFDHDTDRYAWMDLMETAQSRFGWRVHAWGRMGNHCHFLLEPPELDLVAGMRCPMFWIGYVVRSPARLGNTLAAKRHGLKS